MALRRLAGLLCVGIVWGCAAPERQFADQESKLDGSLTSDADATQAKPDAKVPTEGPKSDAATDKDASLPNLDSAVAVSDAANGSGNPDSGSAVDAANGTPDAHLAIDAAPDAAPTCRATGPEECFNGVDDDCNGKLDCEDSACDVGAMCVPQGEVQGVLVLSDEACPKGYEAGEQKLFQGLTGEPCAGCGCDATPTQCGDVEIFFYADNAACQADAKPYTGGTSAGNVQVDCPDDYSTPIMEGSTYGYRVGPVSVVSGTGMCSPSGTATTGAVQWSQSTKLCAAEGTGTGCQPGYACVPAPDRGTPCSETASSCESGLDEQVWYEDYSDSRRCGECKCGGEGSCENISVELGSDWGCHLGKPDTPNGEKDCDTTPYSPPAEQVGAPTDPVCESSVETAGVLTPVRSHTLCCGR